MLQRFDVDTLSFATWTLVRPSAWSSIFVMWVFK